MRGRYEQPTYKDPISLRQMMYITISILLLAAEVCALFVGFTHGMERKGVGHLERERYGLAQGTHTQREPQTSHS